MVFGFGSIDWLYVKITGRKGCPFCPFRSFASLRYLRTHIGKYHCVERQFIAAGTKQIKVVLALYDEAASSQAAPQSLLRESAALLRSTVDPPLPHSMSNIDKKIRLVFDGTGPAYVNMVSGFCGMRGGVGDEMLGYPTHLKRAIPGHRVFCLRFRLWGSQCLHRYRVFCLRVRL